MEITKVDQPARLAFPIAPVQPQSAQTLEDPHGLLHWIRAGLWGECPECKGTYHKQVNGWNKLQCKNCGKTWAY